MLLLQCVLKDWGSSKWILHCVSYENDQSGNIWGVPGQKKPKFLKMALYQKPYKILYKMLLQTRFHDSGRLGTVFDCFKNIANLVLLKEK